jgi:hypothetical protein
VPRKSCNSLTVAPNILFRQILRPLSEACLLLTSDAAKLDESHAQRISQHLARQCTAGRNRHTSQHHQPPRNHTSHLPETNQKTNSHNHKHSHPNLENKYIVSLWYRNARSGQEGSNSKQEEKNQKQKKSKGKKKSSRRGQPAADASAKAPRRIFIFAHDKKKK